MTGPGDHAVSDGRRGDGADAGASGSTSSIDCAPYEAFGDIAGKTVTVYTSIVEVEGEFEAGDAVILDAIQAARRIGDTR